MIFIKKTGLWLTGILFFVEILGDILVRIGSFMLSGKYFLYNSNNLTSTGVLNLFSELLFVTFLLTGIFFLSQLFNKECQSNLSSYKWVYSLTILLLFAFVCRYLSNEISIEKIVAFEFDLLVIFFSLTLIFFFQKSYKSVAQEKYSYMVYICSSVICYLFYLFYMAPGWEYHRVVFW